MGMSLGCCAPIISMAFIYSIGWTGIPSNDPLQSEDFLFSSLPFQEEKKKKNNNSVLSVGWPLTGAEVTIAKEDGKS